MHVLSSSDRARLKSALRNLDAAPRSEAGGNLTAAAASPPVPRFTVDPDADFAARLDALVHWVALRSRAQTVFVSDAEGLPVIAGGAQPAEVAVSSVILRMLDQFPSAPADAVSRFTIEQARSGRTFHLFPTRLQGAVFALGLVLNQPMPADLVLDVVEALDALEKMQ